MHPLKEICRKLEQKIKDETQDKFGHVKIPIYKTKWKQSAIKFIQNIIDPTWAGQKAQQERGELIFRFIPKVNSWRIIPPDSWKIIKSPYFINCEDINVEETDYTKDYPFWIIKLDYSLQNNDLSYGVKPSYRKINIEFKSEVKSPKSYNSTPFFIFKKPPYNVYQFTNEFLEFLLNNTSNNIEEADIQEYKVHLK